MAAPDLMSQFYAANPGAAQMFGGMPGVAQQPQFNPFQQAMPGVPQYVTADQVQKLVDERLKAFTPAPAPGPDLSRLQAVLNQVSDLARRALPAEDYKALQDYIAGGGQGFAAMMAGEAMYPLMQLLWETIKENKQ